MSGRLWLNGALLERADVRIDPADRGLLLADGLFETLAVRAGAVVRLQAHLDRLAAGAAVLGLPLPYGRDALADALADTARANAVSDGALRLTLTAGVGPRGLPRPDPLAPTVLITAAASPPVATPLPPARLRIATLTRRNEHSPLSRVKSLAYLDQILARREAAAQGDDDALLLNTASALACASAATLFVVLADGALVTPPLADGALPGTRRAAVLAALDGREATLRPVDLWTAREVFLTSSLMVRPVCAVDGRPVGTDCPGPATLAAAAT